MTGKSEDKKQKDRHYSEGGNHSVAENHDKLKLMKQDLDILSVRSVLPEDHTIWSIAIPKTGTDHVWLGTGGSPLNNEENPSKSDGGFLLQLDYGGIVQQKFELNIWPYNILLMLNGKILISSAWKSCEIMQVTKSGKVSIFSDMQPYCIYGMAQSENGDVYTCAQNRSSYAGKIIRFSSNGEHLQNIERDETKRRIFSFPFDISISPGGKICVKDDKMLIVLSPTGQVVTKTKALSGHWLVHKIVCDKYNNIIGGGKKSTHIIDMDGKWVNSYKKGGSDPTKIWGLALDPRGNLWMGTNTGQIIVAKYLLL